MKETGTEEKEEPVSFVHKIYKIKNLEQSLNDNQSMLFDELALNQFSIEIELD